MEFHPGKCQVLKISKKRLTTPFDYKIHGQSLEVSKSAKYLGVTIDNELKWTHQIQSVKQKANGTLAFLRRNIPKICPLSTKEKCVRSLVKPILNYGCCVWDPHQKNQIESLEKVNKNAARFVTNNYSYRTGSTKENMTQLKWTPLKEQRAKIKLNILYKATNKHIEIDNASELRRSIRRGRHSDEHSFIVSPSRTDCHKFSFFPSTIRLWNALSEEIKCSNSPDKFEQELHTLIITDHYSYRR